MTTLYLTHEVCLKHDNGPVHPERPDRLRAVEKVLSHEIFAPLIREKAPKGKTEHIALAHPQNYIELIKSARPEEGYAYIDPDTSMNPHTWKALIRQVGAATHAVDQVMTGAHKNAFIGMRPPGHHAEATRAMGFCIFNHVAIAAYYARQKHGAERVAVIDFDVHHGNGTQDIFWSDKDMFYGSTHEMPLFPGTGAVNETGVGNICNAPLKAMDGGERFKMAMEERILPALKNFSPDLLIISAGFDAHKNDPLANLTFEAEDFGWVTSKLLDFADTQCEGRVISSLEGGYNLESLAKSVAVHVKQLIDAGA